MNLKDLDNLKPIFSVIIPVYNRAELIKRSVGSVLNQSFQNFEIVVVDDCSTDNLLEILNEINSPKIKIVRHKENRGVSAARNTGIKNAEGVLISLLDSDDAFKETFLEKTYEAYKNSGEDVGFYWTGVIKHRSEITPDSQSFFIKKQLWTPSFNSRDEAYRYCLENDALWGTGFGVTAKKEAFENIGYFNEGLKAREDMEILIRLMKNYKFKAIEEFLINIYTDADVRVDSQAINRARAYVQIVDTYKNDILKNKKSKVFFYTMICKSFYDAGSALLSYQYWLKAFIANPTNKDLIKLFIKNTLFVHRIIIK